MSATIDAPPDSAIPHVKARYFLAWEVGEAALCAECRIPTRVYKSAPVDNVRIQHRKCRRCGGLSKTTIPIIPHRQIPDI